MREIEPEQITAAVRQLCMDANRVLPEDLETCIHCAAEEETSPLGKAILCDLCDNMDAARELQIPVCQDTGMAVIFAEVGQDNTPAILHTRLVEGDRLSLMVAPKGFGSENMSRMKMFTPSASLDDIVGFVVETARVAGSNPCPPMVLGVGIGGDFEKCAILAKMALCRPVSEPNPDSFYAELEKRMLDEVNALGIGPQGFGGDTTALCVHIESFPTHIAGLPVAVNVGCHVTRHKKITI